MKSYLSEKKKIFLNLPYRNNVAISRQQVSERIFTLLYHNSTTPSQNNIVSEDDASLNDLLNIR